MIFIFDINNNLQPNDYEFLRKLFNDSGLYYIEIVYHENEYNSKTRGFMCYTVEDINIFENHKHSVSTLFFLNYTYHTLNIIVSNKYIDIGG